MARVVMWIALIAMLVIWGTRLMNPGGGTQVAYTAFRAQVDSGNVQRVVVQGEKIQGELARQARYITQQGDTVQYKSFVTYVPSFGDPTLLSDLQAKGVEIITRPTGNSGWWPVLFTSVLPLLVLVGLGWLLFRQMRSRGSNILSIGKSGAKLYDRRKERTTFEDVAGAEGAKTELREIVEFLKSPERFQRLGGAMPKGVLLVGPPGTGKTLLARAVAGEADVPFFIITGSDFMEMFVGVGASRVRDLFNTAKKASPSIIFIDELDSIGRRRGAGLGSGQDEREQTLNQLLSELDGFEPNENVVVMAATNRPDILDPALLRPGRFDRRITVDLPTTEQRLAILKLHARDKPLSDDVDLDALARGTPGLSGADLENVLNEAALIAARKDGDRIQQVDVDEARDKVLMGLKREGLALTDEELKLLAYHEGGHAVVAASLPKADPIHKVSIIPRGRAMGVTQQLPERDRYIYERDYMLDRIAVMMGGRAAEELAFGTQTSGAQDDFQQATQLARRMVLDWGMSELGPVSGGRREQVFLGEEIAQRREYSEETAREVDEQVRSIIEKCYARAMDALKQHRGVLDRLAQTLLKEEEVPGSEVLQLMKDGADGHKRGDTDGTT